MTGKRLLELGFTMESNKDGYYSKSYWCGETQVKLKILLWGNGMQALIDPTEHGNEATICFPATEEQLNQLCIGLGVTQNTEKATYWQTLAKAALAYIEEISTNSELDTEEKRRRLDSWKELQIIKSKQYCTCEAPIVRFDGEEYCGCCQKGVL